MDENDRLNYRLGNQSNAGATVLHIDKMTNELIERVSFVSNDYLGFSQHV